MLLLLGRPPRLLHITSCLGATGPVSDERKHRQQRGGDEKRDEHSELNIHTATRASTVLMLRRMHGVFQSHKPAPVRRVSACEAARGRAARQLRLRRGGRPRCLMYSCPPVASSRVSRGPGRAQKRRFNIRAYTRRGVECEWVRIYPGVARGRIRAEVAASLVGTSVPFRGTSSSDRGLKSWRYRPLSTLSGEDE